MNFSDTIIERLEQDGVILFNGRTSAMIEVSYSDYAYVCAALDFTDLCKLGDPKLAHWLKENGFLDSDPFKFEQKKRRSFSTAFARKSQRFSSITSNRAPLSILWAITPLCNIRCVYCFPEGNSAMSQCTTASDATVAEIVRQIVEARVLRVTLSGGECMLDKRLWHILDALCDQGIATSIISNGSPVNLRNIERLKTTNTQIAISLDGPNEAVNALSRGPGIFIRALTAIDLCVRYDMEPIVICTVNRRNFEHIPVLCDLLVERGITAITLQDLRPFGSIPIYRDWKLTADQESRVQRLCTDLEVRHPRIFFNFTELLIHHKANTCGKVMNCPAGRNFAYLDFKGDLYPCTSLPSIKLGNIIKDGDIKSLWQESEGIKVLRELQARPVSSLEVCGGCGHIDTCEGGCRGDALFWSGSLEGLPSRCPRVLGNG